MCTPHPTPLPILYVTFSDRISRGLETRMQTLRVQTLHLVSLLVLAQSNQTFPGPIASGISAAVRRPCMEINTW